MIRRCFLTSLNSVNRLTAATVGKQMRPLTTSLPALTKVTEDLFQAKEQSQLKTTTNDAQVLNSVDKLVSQKHEGRLCAIVHICGKQYRITDGDIIIVSGYWPPTVGDKIRLDKVLLVAGKDFSLIGTPILQPGVVDVQATVIEKTLSHTRTTFFKKKTKQYMRINFMRQQLTMLRINSIQIQKPVREISQSDEKADDVRIF